MFQRLSKTYLPFVALSFFQQLIMLVLIWLYNHWMAPALFINGAAVILLVILVKSYVKEWRVYYILGKSRFSFLLDYMILSALALFLPTLIYPYLGLDLGMLILAFSLIFLGFLLNSIAFYVLLLKL